MSTADVLLLSVMIQAIPDTEYLVHFGHAVEAEPFLHLCASQHVQSPPLRRTGIGSMV